MNFESIANNHPSEQAAIGKLKELLFKSRTQPEEFTLNRLCDLVNPHDRDELAMILGELSRQGLLKLVIRVISPTTQGGVGDFSTLEEIPRVIHDRRSDTNLEVSSENLRIVYKAAQYPQ